MVDMIIEYAESVSNQKNVYLCTQIKKLLISSADCMLCMSQQSGSFKTALLESVFSIIEKCCPYIQPGEKDEMRVYLLGFRMHAARGNVEEVMHVFQKIIESQHFNGDEALECFNVLAYHRMAEAAISIGQHLLKACDKHVVDPS